jgi:hypothetical protein
LNKSADAKPGADKPRRGPKPQNADSQKPVADVVASTPESSEPAASSPEPVADQAVEAPVVSASEVTAEQAE